MTQTNWNSLGTPVLQIDNLSSVGRNADGRLEVFVSSPSGAGPSELWHIWQTSPGSTWSTWDSLNKPPNISSFSSAAVGQNADGRLEVFVTGSDGALWHIWQTSPGGNWSNTWFSSGQPSAMNHQYHPTVVRTADGRLEVFVTGSDGALWHIWQTAPNGTWGPWDSLGKPSNADLRLPAAAKNADERIEVFTVGSDGALWHIWQTEALGPWSNTWFSSGKPSTVSYITPVVSQNADGRLEIFTLDADGALWHIWQTAPNGTWSAWASSGTPANVQFTTHPTVGKNKDGRLEVLIIGNDRALWHTWQTSPGHAWSAWDSLGAPPNVGLYTPVVSENADGRLEVFAPNDAASENALWHTWQVAPGGSWG